MKRRDLKDTSKPTQPTQPKGKDEDGKPYEPVEIPIPRKREVLGALERASRKPKAGPNEPSKDV